MQVSNFNLKAALLAAGLILAPSAFATDITGAGATFHTQFTQNGLSHTMLKLALS